LKRALRRFLAVAGLIVLSVAVLLVATCESDPWLYEKSSLRWIDPSYGPDDAALLDAISLVLSGQTERDYRLEQYPQVGSMSDAEFRRRVASVPGWDALVVFQPYQRGNEMPRQPAIASWWLQRQLDHTEGQSTEQYCKVLLIRNQQSVGVLILEGSLETTGVVTRSR
jgi:hypothetical protein